MPLKRPSRDGLARPGDDPDHLAAAVEQRAPGVPGVHRCVELDQSAEGPAVRRLDRSLQAGDDPGRQRADEAEGMPDGVRLVADLAGATEHRRDDRLGRALGHEHRDVVVGVGGDDLADRPCAVDEGQADRRRVVDHVKRGQDRTARVDDHPGAEPGPVSPRRRAGRLDLDE